MRSIDIDLRLDGGAVRIKRRTGVTERRNAQAIEAMLRHLWNQPTHRNLVREVADGKRNLVDLYLAFLTGRLAEAGPATEDREVQPMLDEWLPEFQASESHKRCVRGALKQLLALTRRAARLSELPDLLEQYRASCVATNKPRAFNYAKHAVQALIRDKVEKRGALITAIRDVPPMPERKRGVLGLSVDEARAVRRKLTEAGQEDASRIWWGMCCTGMGATEFWGEWTVLADRVRIVGTKRPGRRWGSDGRDVPLVFAPQRPEMTADHFAKVLRKAGASPYQGRHSYGCWMEDAEIPRTRRKMYLGHGVKDVTDRYERREITAFLAEDRDRLLKVLGTEPTLALMRTHGLVVGQTAQEA